jgi:hypothetical protein
MKTKMAGALGAFLLGIGAARAAPPGIIRSFDITSAVPAYGGATPPGAAGPYQVITGVVHGALDPASPANRSIADLALAPRAKDGLVDYRTDVVILRPAHAADARRILFYDVVNRGNKLGIGAFIGGGALNADAPPPAGFPSLLRMGATVVWSGWQGDIPVNGTAATAATAALGTAFPVATANRGKPITGMSREEYIPDYAGGPADTIALSYKPADLADRASVRFTARQSWLPGYGTAHPGPASYDAPSVPVTAWHYARGPAGTTVVFTPPAAVPGPNGVTVPADAGTIYSFVYRARDPRVNAVGFAAVRDLVAFLRHDAKDAAGHANPLADLAVAKCVLATCEPAPAGNFDVAIGEGISQSGRFLKEFLYRGFNADGQGDKVFDGMLPIISGARMTWIDARFSQPGRWSKQHEDHWQFGDQFPFTYATITDPVSGRTDGLMRNCTRTRTCPLVMQTDGEFEWWGARAALVVTDGHGHDLKLPPTVRYYLVPGTQHGGGPGVSTGLYPMPAAGSLCALPASPVAETPVWRALVPALVAWVATGKAPPESQYPTVAGGTLVAPAKAGYPELHVGFTGQVNTLFVTDYSHAVPAVHHDRPYTVLVPKVDANGNATTGVMVPDVGVPLASYVGWNLRGPGHAIGEGCISNAAAIPLPVDAAAKAAAHDTRASLAALYTGRANYQAKVAAAAAALVRAGTLLPDDATGVFVANARKVSPAILPEP